MMIKPIAQFSYLQEIELGIFIPPLGMPESLIPTALQQTQREIHKNVDEIAVCEAFIWSGGGESIWAIIDQHAREHDTTDNLFPCTCIDCRDEWLCDTEIAIETFCVALGHNLYHLQRVAVRSIFSRRGDWRAEYHRHGQANSWESTELGSV